MLGIERGGMRGIEGEACWVYYLPTMVGVLPPYHGGCTTSLPWWVYYYPVYMPPYYTTLGTTPLYPPVHMVPSATCTRGQRCGTTKHRAQTRRNP